MVLIFIVSWTGCQEKEYSFADVLFSVFLFPLLKMSFWARFFFLLYIKKWTYCQFFSIFSQVLE